MRNLLFAGLLAFAAPATAQSFDPRIDDDVARSLPHPAEVDAIGRTLDRTVGAFLEVPIGGVANALDPYGRPVHPGTTLGDMAGRDDPWFRERMHGRIGALTGSMNAMIEQMAVLTPVLRRSLADLQRNLDAAMRDHDYRGYDYDDEDYDDY